MTKIILTSIFVGLFGIFYIQKSYWFRSVCKECIEVALNNALSAQISFELQNINLLTGTALLTDLKLAKDNHFITYSNVICRFSWCSFFKNIWCKDDKIKIKTSFLNGSITIFGQQIIRNCSAEFSFNLNLNDKISYYGMEDCLVNSTFDLCYKNQAVEHCVLLGSLLGNKGHFKIKNSNDLIAIDFYKGFKFTRISSFLRSEFFKNILGIDQDIKGTATINCLIDISSWEYKLRANFSNVYVQDFLAGELKWDDIRLLATNCYHDEHRIVIQDFVAKQKLIDCRYKNENVHCLIKSGSLLQKLFSIEGVCDLLYKGCLNGKKLTGTLNSTNLNIIIPKVYNVIKKLDTELEVDLNTRTLLIRKLLLGCHKGNISIPNFLINLDLQKSISVPFVLSNLFFSLNKNFFVYLNGKPTLTFTNNSEGAKALLLSGNLDIDKGGIRYNFDIGTNNMSYNKNKLDINLNLVIKSKNINMTHQFFDLNFFSKLTVQGSAQSPKISGMISILDGVFKFPSKNLDITNARIYISDLETVLDINAKGHLSKHDITMRILGPISNPKMLFESQPLLSTEEIISLLVTGSHNTALNCFVPNLFIQNFESLIFGSNAKYSNDKNYEPVEYVKQILKVLKNIRVVKVKEGKDIEKGKYVVELDISDRLRATIANDFNFAKPKQISLEYDLSDGITIKGSKDRNNNVGGELELKWKV